MRSTVLLVLVLALGLTSLSLAVEDIWTKKADMPTARFFLGTCAVDGKIYAIGGCPAPHVSISVVEVYDPVTNTWTSKANMSTARVGLGASVVNGKIYAIGGAEPGVGTVEEYDPGTDTWMRKTNMPTARGFLSTSAVKGKIYAIGGATSTSGPAVRTVEEYDPATDTWARKADLPEPRYLHAAGVVDGKVYIIAGSWQAYTASPAVYEYDPATDTWERKADAPTVGSWLSASAVDGRIYVIGIGEDVFPKGVEEYDPATDTWTSKADMPTPRAGLSTTALNGKIYAIGGSATTAYNGLSTVEEYYPNPLVVDFNGDEIVNFKDFSMFAQYWYQDQSPFVGHMVDYKDLAALTDYWLQEVLPISLIAYWKLDETEGLIAYDSVRDYDGTLHGEPVWQPTDGKKAGALDLDGTDDYVSTDFVLNPVDGPFSVFAWIKGGAPGQVILSQMDITSGRFARPGSAWLCTDPLEGKFMTKLMDAFFSPLESESVITDGEWHHVGLVYDLDAFHRHLYVDRAEVAKDTDIVAGIGSDGGLYFGAGNDLEPGTFWSGLIDDVKIYDRAVTP
jgi:N-acetylneuraminic acid mutarotase